MQFFDGARALPVSGYNNNCGLNSVMGMITDLIRENPENEVFYTEPYQRLLSDLNEFLYLEGDDRLKDYKDVQKLLEMYPHYQDYARIFAVPLRKGLSRAWNDYIREREDKYAIVYFENLMNRVFEVAESAPIHDGMTRREKFRAINIGLGEQSGEEHGAFLEGNLDLILSIENKEEAAKKIKYANMAIEARKTNGAALAAFKSKYVEMFASELMFNPMESQPEWVKEINALMGFDENELNYLISRKRDVIYMQQGSHVPSKTWKYAFKALEGRGGEPAKISDLRHKLVSYLYREKLGTGGASLESLNSKYRIILDIAGAEFTDKGIVFTKEPVTEYDFSDPLVTGALDTEDIILPDNIELTTPVAVSAPIVEKTTSSLEHLIREKRKVFSSGDEAEIFSRASKKRRFYLDNIVGQPESFLLKKAAIMRRRAKGDEIEKYNRKLEEAIDFYTNESVRIGRRDYTDLISLARQVSDPQRNPACTGKFEEEVELEQGAKDYMKYLRDQSLDGWLQSLIVRSDFNGADGARIFAGYMGIESMPYAIKEISIHDGLVQSPFVVDEDNKVVRMTFKNWREYTNAGTPARGASVELGRLPSLSVKNPLQVSEPEAGDRDKPVTIELDVSSILSTISKQDLLSKLEASRTAHFYAPSRECVQAEVDEPICEMKLLNRGGIHWEREMREQDRSYYSQRFRQRLGYTDTASRVSDDVQRSWKQMLAASRKAAIVPRDAASTKKSRHRDTPDPIGRKKSVTPAPSRILRRASEPGAFVRSKGPGETRGRSQSAIVPGRTARPSGGKKTATPVPSGIVSSRRKTATPVPSTTRLSPSPELSRQLQRHKEMQAALELRKRQANPLLIPRPSLSSSSCDYRSTRTITTIPLSRESFLEHAKEFKSTVSKYSHMSSDLTREGTEFRKDTPSYNKFISNGAVKGDLELLYQQELRKAQAFSDTRMNLHRGEDDEIIGYTITKTSDDGDDIEVVTAEHIDDKVEISTTVRDEDSIYIMLEPAIKHAEKEGIENMVIQVMDANNPEYALDIFEKAFESGLSPEIKDEATLHAISKLEELSRRYESLKAKVDEPEESPLVLSSRVTRR